MFEPSPYPSNRSFTRWWTARELQRVRDALGDEHPDTLAAHAAAVEAWGPGRIAPLPIHAREIGKPDRRVEGERAFGEQGRRVSDGLLDLLTRVGARSAK